MPDGGTFAPDGALLCTPCTSTLKAAAASATIVRGEREIRERKDMMKAGAGIAAGCGATSIVITVIVALVFIVVVSKLVGCLEKLPPWFDVG